MGNDKNVRIGACYRSAKKTGHCGFIVPILCVACSPEGIFRIRLRYFYVAKCGVYCADN